VVATGTVVDSRRAAEFAPDQNRDIIQHATFFEIQHQSAHGLIELDPWSRTRSKFCPWLSQRPYDKADGANAGFDQTTSHQNLFVTRWSSVVLVLVRLSVTIAFTDFGRLFGNIQRCSQPIRGQTPKAASVNESTAGHHAGCIGLTFELIEARSSDGDRQVDPGDTIQRQIVHSIAVWAGMAGKQPPETPAGQVLTRAHASFLGQSNGGGNAWITSDRRFFQAQTRWPGVRRSRRYFFDPIRSGTETIMSPVAAHHGPNHNQAIHDGRKFREAFADLNAGDSRVNRTEFTANFARSIRFDFPHVLVRRTATEENIDDAFLIARRSLCRQRLRLASDWPD
jgi:hypothetical protein